MISKSTLLSTLLFSALLISLPYAQAMELPDDLQAGEENRRAREDRTKNLEEWLVRFISREVTQENVLLMLSEVERLCKEVDPDTPSQSETPLAAVLQQERPSLGLIKLLLRYGAVVVRVNNTRISPLEIINKHKKNLNDKLLKELKETGTVKAPSMASNLYNNLNNIENALQGAENDFRKEEREREEKRKREEKQKREEERLQGDAERLNTFFASTQLDGLQQIRYILAIPRDQSS